MKHLDLFFDEADFKELYDFVLSLTDNLYVECNDSLINSSPELAAKEYRLLCCVEPLILTYNVKNISSFEQIEAVFIEKNFISDHGFYLPGGIACRTNNPETLALYGKISKWIKKKYRKACFAAYYIGPNMYRQWMEHRLEFHFFLDVKSFTVGESDIDFQQLLTHFNEIGYLIKENWHDVRQPDNLYSGNEFFIHAPNAKLHSKLVSRRLFYFPDSEAVFVWKEEKKHLWRFIVDERHFDMKDDSSVRQLWNLCLRLQNDLEG